MALPVSLYNAGISLLGTFPFSYVAYEVCRIEDEPQYKALFDSSIAALQIALANGLSTAAVEYFFYASGMETSGLNRSVITLTGAALSIPLTFVTLRLPLTKSGNAILSAEAHFWKLVSDIKVRKEVEEFLRKLRPESVPSDHYDK